MLKFPLVALTITALFTCGCDTKSVNTHGQKVQKFEKITSQTNPKQDKVNIIFITQVGCAACEQIKEYMVKPEIKAILDKDFIITEIDIAQKEDMPFDWMTPYATPTLYFFDSNDHEIVDTTVRRMSEVDFITTLNEVIEIRDMD